ncbi:BlaI/MecI/CopY family transcriptional regulator [bacterium]|nr:BlaI/MecI/CopY family transcriptional regulator [bacterium]MDG1891894.1 BlaI/MecI/CopY family transcriptional regulator [Verrucomicrobiota bacterium]
MKPTSLDLNPIELEVMGILWDQGALKPSKLEDHLSIEIENGTLRSLLRSLVEKKSQT